MTTINLPENKYDSLEIKDDQVSIDFTRPDSDGIINIDIYDDLAPFQCLKITKEQARQLGEYLISQSQ